MNALVVGAGRMGGFHRRILADLGYDPITVDPDPARGADHTTLPPGRFDIVCIAVPIRDLAEQAAQFAGRTRFLLIEKPMAATIAEARELAELLAGQDVAVGYVERFNPRVRRLCALLADSPQPAWAHFTRWNDRPSPNVALDLEAHDRDLAQFLGLTCPVRFDEQANASRRCREIMICANHVLHVDLTAHDTSPLHAQWHAFLSGQPGYATPSDAIAVLAALDQEVTRCAPCSAS